MPINGTKNTTSATQNGSRNYIIKSDFLTATKLAKIHGMDKHDIELAMEFAHKRKISMIQNGRTRPLVVQKQNNHNKYNYLLYPGGMEKLGEIIKTMKSKEK